MFRTRIRSTAREGLARAEGPCPSGRLAPKVLRLMPYEGSYREIARCHHLSSHSEVAIA